jgi:hypothetical protein
MKFWRERKAFHHAEQTKYGIKMVKSILVILFRKTNPKLLKELCGIIAEFVMAPPHPNDEQALEKSRNAIKKKAAKKKKKISEDEEWDE